MSGTNQLQQPLGNNVPMPGGQLFPAQRRDTVPAMNRMTGRAGTPPSLIGNVPSPQGPMSFQQARRTIGSEFTRNQNALKEMEKALRKLGAIRKSLMGLGEKQDTVTMDDVVHEAGKLVGHGIDPLALAGVLADAPQEGGGEALGAWVAGHAQNAMQAEAQLTQQRDLLNHRAGVNAMHMLMGQASGLPTPEDTQQQSNSLGGGYG